MKVTMKAEKLLPDCKTRFALKSMGEHTDEVTRKGDKPFGKDEGRSELAKLREMIGHTVKTMDYDEAELLDAVKR